MTVFDEFQWRGMVYDASEGIRDVLATEKITVYIGFDPSAASLHVGSLVPIMGLMHLQRHGHSPIALAGGGTGMIGDPSGKTQERQLLSKEKIQDHVAAIRQPQDCVATCRGHYRQRLVASDQQEPSTGANVTKVGPGEWECTGVIFNLFAQRFAALGLHGFRAVLWHQGESDAGQARAGYPAEVQITGEQYFEFMRKLIRASQKQAGWPVPWITAQTTYHGEGDASDAEFRAAMKKLWDQKLSWQGPDTDTLRAEYRDGVHFNAKGLQKHGLMWADKVSAWLEKKIGPK